MTDWPDTASGYASQWGRQGPAMCLATQGEPQE